MKFTRTTKRSDVNGTSLMGYLPSSLTEADIAAKLGEPGPGVDKTTREWAIRFQDGAVATVYDYKGSRWHVGGRFVEVVDRVARILGVPGDRLAGRA